MDPNDLIKEMEQYIPLLKNFKDKDLARKVAKVWYQLWKESKWDKLEEALWNPLCPGVTLITHTTTVTRVAIEFANIRNEIYSESINLDILLAGALLHDASKLIEVEPDGNTGSESKRGNYFSMPFLVLTKPCLKNSLTK